ncbi:hypothetical protein AKO1_013018, partial [Acrasis kona]
MKHLSKFVEKFDNERQTRMKKFETLSKFKVSLINLKRQLKQSIEKAKIVDELFDNAPKDTTILINKATISYTPIRHSHHYDDDLSKYVTRTYHLPQMQDSKERLKEFVHGSSKVNEEYLNNSTPSSPVIAVSDDKVAPIINKKTENVPVKHRDGGDSRIIASVSYRKEEHAKAQKVMNKNNPKETQNEPSLLEEWEQEITGLSRTSSQKLKNSKASELIAYSPMKYQPKPEVKCQEITAKMKNAFVKRSYKWGLLGDPDLYKSDDDEEEERQQRMRHQLNATYA